MTSTTIGFRPNEEDRRILAANGNSPTDTIRRALRLLDHDEWLAQARIEAFRDRDFDVNAEPDAW
jgi:antitoxin ParD1/3/4